MNVEFIIMCCVTALGLAVLAYRNHVMKQATVILKKELPMFQQLAKDHPQCVPSGVIFDEEHLHELTPQVINEFSRNCYFDSLKSKTK